MYFLARSLPVIDRRNWLIHQHYVRNDFVSCKVSSLLSLVMLWTGSYGNMFAFRCSYKLFAPSTFSGGNFFVLEKVAFS